MVKLLKYKWQQLQEIIVEKIESGEYLKGSKLPSERELCDIFGVSRVCVRQVLDKLESEKVITRLPGKGAFVGTLADVPVEDRPKSNLIALTVLGAPTDPPTLEIVEGIRTVMAERDYHLIIEWVKDAPDYEKKVVNKLLTRGVDGLIMTATAGRDNRGEIITNKEFYAELASRHIPFVIFDRYVSDERWSTVGYQVYEPTFKIIKKLIEAGRKKIAYIGLEFSLAGADRYYAYLEAMKNMGLTIDERAIVLANDAESFEPIKWAIHSAKTLIANGTDFDAIMCFSPLIGYVAYKELLKLGKSFGNGKCVGAFEWSAVGDKEFQSVFIGTQRRPLKKMGHRAAEILFEEIEHNGQAEKVHERIEVDVMHNPEIHLVGGIPLAITRRDFVFT